MTTNYDDSSKKRRDERHTKIDDTHKSTTPNKRDTRKWCRGKVGVSHQLECKPYNDVKKSAYGNPQTRDNWRILICITCGKEIDIWCGKVKNKPQWVNNVKAAT